MRTELLGRVRNVKGETVVIYLNRDLLNKLDEYARSRLISRGKAISHILANYFNLGGGEGDGDTNESD